MKRLLVLTALLVLSSFAVRAQTAAQWVTQGRSYLVAHDLPNANSCFYSALGVAPVNTNANVFFAATRLLITFDKPAGTAFLDRLGFAPTNRSVYGWTAGIASDTNGLVYAPSNMLASEITAFLRTNVLTRVIRAGTNLAVVTYTNYSLNLASNETSLAAVTLDYGDILMLRSMLKLGEYFIYTTHSWNLDVQLETIRSLYTNGPFNIETLFAYHTNLLRFIPANDLNAARTSFTNAVDLYVAASQFIRSPYRTNNTHLFNFDADMAAQEQQFRLTLQDLKSSLRGVTFLRAFPDYTVYLPALFDPTRPVRSFLPSFYQNGFILRSADPTFGGFITGVDPAGLDSILAKMLPPVPFISSSYSLGQTFAFDTQVVHGRGYVVQVSTDLVNWSDLSGFLSFEDTYHWLESEAEAQPHRFFRVVDRPVSDLPSPPNDSFANRLPLTGLGVITSGYIANASLEPDEPGYGLQSVWWSWTAPVSGLVVAASTGGSAYTDINVYTGSSLTALVQVPNETPPGISYNGYAFYATAGVTYQIRVGAWNFGSVRIAISSPPDLTVASPLDGTISLVPTSFTIAASANDPDGSISEMVCYADGVQLVSLATNQISCVWSNVSAGFHSVDLGATDNLGVSTYVYLSVTVRPPNDNFANRIILTGSQVTANGTNNGASKEPGEPDHAGDPGGSSVWWAWTAPVSGAVTISVDLLSDWDYEYPALLAVYTGSSLASLNVIADDASDYGRAAQVSFSATAGTSYKIAVDGYQGASGRITLDLNQP